MNKSGTKLTREYCEKQIKSRTPVYVGGKVIRRVEDLPKDLPTQQEADKQAAAKAQAAKDAAAKAK